MSAQTPDVLDSDQAGDKVIRGGAARTAAYVAGILVGLAATPLMVRHLGVADFGRYVTVTSIIFIAAGLTEGGLAGIGVREYTQREGARADRLLRDLLGMRLALTALAVVGALVFGLLAGYEDVLLLGLLISGVGLLFANLFGVYVVPMTAWLRFGWLAGLDLLRQVITAVLIVGLVALNATLSPFFAATAAANLAALVVIWALARRRAPARPGYDRAEWRSLLTESLPYAAAIAMSVLYFRVAIVLMSVIASETETGYYALAFRIIEIVSGVPWLLVGSAFPVLARAARDDADRLRYALARTFEVSLILGVWVAVATGLGAPFAVDVIGDLDEFEPSVPVLSVLGVAMIGTFLIACWGHALLTLRRQSELMKANAAAFVVGTALAAVLIDAEGALGGAIATTTTELLLAVVYLLLLVRARADLRPPHRIVVPVAIAAAAATAIPLLVGTPSVVSVVVGSVVYLGLLAALRALPPEIMQALRMRRAAHA
jgi:O-antigen/teichoic acid export membrane protein